MTLSAERQLRVAIIAERYWPYVDGTARMLGQLAAGLATAGIHVTVVAPQWDTRTPVAALHRGVRIARLRRPARATGLAFSPRRLRLWLKAQAEEFDLLLVSGLRHAARTCVRAARKLGLPVALRAEAAGLAGDCHWQIESRNGRAIKRTCYRADALIAPCESIRDELIAAGYPRSRIHHCPGGVASGEPLSAATRSNARKIISTAHPAFRLEPGTPLAVYLGPLTAEHNPGLLIESWQSVHADVPKARLWMVGEGALRSELARRVTELNMRNCVLFPGSFQEIRELFQAANLALWPGREGNIRPEQLEAMAAGCAVLLAETPGARRLLAQGESGLLLPDDDPDHWAQTILATLQDSKQAARLGTAAQARATEHYPEEQMIESHLQLFGQLRQRPGKRSSDHNS